MKFTLRPENLFSPAYWDAKAAHCGRAGLKTAFLYKIIGFMRHLQTLRDPMKITPQTCDQGRRPSMLAQIFRGIGQLVPRVKALVTVFFGSSVYYQTVNVITKFPALLPQIIADTALKYRRTVTSARYRVNPSTDRVEILCTVTNVTSWTVGAGLLVGQIGVATAVPGGSGYHPNYLPAKTDGQIAPKSDGELVASTVVSAVSLRGLHLKVWLDLGPGNGPIQEFRDELFLNF